jgi:hypothetical protein
MGPAHESHSNGGYPQMSVGLPEPPEALSRNPPNPRPPIIGDAGAKDLRKALPDCQIDR